MPNYKIEHSRHDCPTQIAHSFTAKDDAEANIVLLEFVKKEQYSWDDLVLYEIVTPAVAEKTRVVSHADRQGRD